MASKKITTSELDFDSIKSNLKTYLQGQDQFQDYDFEGSGLSVLLDILAYNTHYNALYNNLSINEMFLDSARKRNSVVSIAKEIGYTPSSARCAKATVNVTFNSLTSMVHTIPLNTPFSTSVDGVTYTFYNSSVLVAPSASTSYTFSGVELIEKSNLLTYKYTVTANTKYIIPNANVDTSTLKVTVQESVGSSSITTFTQADNIVDVTSTSSVYWIKEIDDGLYELTFGNGVIGKALSNGNIVNLEYAVSSLDAPNGAKLFSYGGTLLPNVTALVTTTSKASGGTTSEDIDSIRFNAPRYYSSQNRCVNIQDYKSVISAYFPAAKSIAAWGGEDNIPPVYGKTYISIKPKDGDLLTSAQKTYITDTILASKSVMTIMPEIIDPEYISLLIKSTVYYNDLETTRSADSIKSLVTATILDYDNNDLQKFDGVFKYSKLSYLIDSCEESIVSNITTVTIKKEITPKYNISATYTVNIINPIYYSGADEDIVISSGFYINGSTYIHYVTDDGNGVMKLFYVNENGIRVAVNNSIGTVDYANGVIKLNDLSLVSIVGDIWYLYIKPSSNDVVSALQQIVRVSTEDLIVDVITDKSAVGDLRGGKNYTFTTSRI